MSDWITICMLKTHKLSIIDRLFIRLFQKQRQIKPNSNNNKITGPLGSVILGSVSKNKNLRNRYWNLQCHNEIFTIVDPTRNRLKIDYSRCESCEELFEPGTRKIQYKSKQWHDLCFHCKVCKIKVREDEKRNDSLEFCFNFF